MNKKQRLLAFIYLCFGFSSFQSTFAYQDIISLLPDDLKGEVILLLTQNAKFKEAMRNVRSVFCLNRKHRELLNNNRFVDILIFHLSKKFGIVNKHYIAELLGASVWLKSHPYQSDSELERQLHRACEEGKVEEMRTILSCNVNVNAEDSLRFSSLYYALQRGSLETIKELVRNGAYVNVSLRKSGETVLMQVIPYLDKDLIELVLDHGANVNVRDSSGKTALFRLLDLSRKAVSTLLGQAGNFECNKKEIVKLLLKYGARAIPAYNIIPWSLKDPLITICTYGTYCAAYDILDYVLQYWYLNGLFSISLAHSEAEIKNAIEVFLSLIRDIETSYDDRKKERLTSP